MENESPTYQPAPVKPASSGGKKVFILVLIILSLVLIGVGVFYFVSQKNKTTEASPTPIDYFETTPVQTLEPTPVVSATPLTANRKEITIEILNGTGIPKEASFLEGILKNLGYLDIKSGNAETQTYSDTQVSYATTVDTTVQQEITQALENTYKVVKVVKATSQTTNVKIITGLRKGSTSKPSATSTATPKVSPTPTVSSSPTATP